MGTPHIAWRTELINAVSLRAASNHQDVARLFALHTEGASVASMRDATKVQSERFLIARDTEVGNAASTKVVPSLRRARPRFASLTEGADAANRRVARSRHAVAQTIVYRMVAKSVSSRAARTPRRLVTCFAYPTEGKQLQAKSRVPVTLLQQLRRTVTVSV